jgi:hypothetical protein
MSHSKHWQADVPYIHGHWNIWHASHAGRRRLHLIYILRRQRNAEHQKNRNCFHETWYLHERTLRFRHDLQFMDSLGSLLMRRVGSLSMLTWARGMGARGTGGTAGGGGGPNR